MQITSSHVSESTRVTTAREARFRIGAPNSTVRTIVVVALDANDDEIAHYRAHHDNGAVQFLDAQAFGFPQRSDNAASLNPFDERHCTQQIARQLTAAELIVVVGQEGVDPQLGERIGEFCKARGRLLTCLIRRAPRGQAVVCKTTEALRPRSSMLVLVNGVGYLSDLLEALGG